MLEFDRYARLLHGLAPRIGENRRQFLALRSWQRTCVVQVQWLQPLSFSYHGVLDRRAITMRIGA